MSMMSSSRPYNIFAMMPRIRLQERTEAGAVTREIPVTREEFVIGRGQDCDLRLADDDISRHHCSIHSSGAESVLLDLGSANGTYLNGQRIRSQSTLQSRDRIDLGNHSFVVLFDDDQVSQVAASLPDPNRVTRRIDLPK
jgi:pSer/pThr/pTyr-binding forkhead associated (FHA) protein